MAIIERPCRLSIDLPSTLHPVGTFDCQPSPAGPCRVPTTIASMSAASVALCLRQSS